MFKQEIKKENGRVIISASTVEEAQNMGIFPFSGIEFPPTMNGWVFKGFTVVSWTNPESRGKKSGTYTAAVFTRLKTNGECDDFSISVNYISKDFVDYSTNENGERLDVIGRVRGHQLKHGIGYKFVSHEIRTKYNRFPTIITLEEDPNLQVFDPETGEIVVDAEIIED